MARSIQANGIRKVPLHETITVDGDYVSKIELDDQILEHPKFILAAQLGGSDAVHLWLGLRAYCAQKLTDGFIPDHMLYEVRGPKSKKKRDSALSALKESKLIEEKTSENFQKTSGIFLHDYLDWSASKAQVLNWRKANAERKRKSRDASRCDNGVTEEVSRCDSAVSHDVIPGPSPSPSPSPSLISDLPEDIYNLTREDSSSGVGPVAEPTSGTLPQSAALPPVASVQGSPATSGPRETKTPHGGKPKRPDPMLDAMAGGHDSDGNKMPSRDQGYLVLFEAYKKATGFSGAKMDWRRKEFYVGLFHDGVTAEEISMAVGGAKLDPWAVREKLPERPIIGSASQREKYIAMYNDPPKPKDAKKPTKPAQPNNESNRYQFEVE